LLPTTVVGSYPQPEWLVDRAMLSKVVPRTRLHAMWRLPAEHLEEAQDDEAQQLFETNVFGLLRVTRAVVPHMRAQSSGAVVNVSSLAGKVSSPFGGLYAATKHAVEALSDALYFELHPFGVRVAIVEPGGFDTRFGDNRMMERKFDAASPYADLERRPSARHVPATTRARPGDVARRSPMRRRRSAPRRCPVGKHATHRRLGQADVGRGLRKAMRWHSTSGIRRSLPSF
jgi:NAD(P)-dependent dehydrogenase (short-subunit alcohol dehydrogenase family)